MAGPSLYLIQQLSSRLGMLKVRTATRDAADLARRYLTHEPAVLALVTRMAIAGRASRAMADRLTEELCGYALDGDRATSVVAGLNLEIARFLHRQLENEFPIVEEARWNRGRSWAACEA